jgi:signal transduction histidine kinase
MTRRSWPVLMVGFGILLTLIAFFGAEGARRLQQINGEIASAQERFQLSNSVLTQVRSEVYLSGILIRDFLLDPSSLAGVTIKEQLVEIRSSIARQLNGLEPQLNSNEAELLKRLHSEIDLYWQSMDPIFSWTFQEKVALSTFFLKKQVLPRRQAVLSIADQIRRVNDSNFERQRDAVRQSWANFHDFLFQITAISLVLGIAVALVSVLRIHRLECLAEAQRKQSDQIQVDLRRLSQQLVRAQEHERKLISRELHDEVGQMLTGLRMELGNLDRLRHSNGPGFLEHLEEARSLGSRALDVVRNMAMGLRPSMLDDLGLVPAIEWQSKEFSRRSGIPVNLQIDGRLDHISDRHRTCIYRVVQEALTNCARHSQAHNIYISLHGHEDLLSLAIRDDGIGFDSAQRYSSGIGLIGIEERVQELAGTVEIVSHPHKGTSVQVKIPYSGEV